MFTSLLNTTPRRLLLYPFIPENTNQWINAVLEVLWDKANDFMGKKGERQAEKQTQL